MYIYMYIYICNSMFINILFQSYIKCGIGSSSSYSLIQRIIFTKGFLIRLIIIYCPKAPSLVFPSHQSVCV